MSVERCFIKEFEIRQQAQGSKLSKRHVEETMTFFRRRFQEHAQSMPRTIAMERAALEAQAGIKARVEQKKRAAALNARAQNEAAALIKAHPDRPRAAGLAKITFDPRGFIVSDNAFKNSHRVERTAYSLIADFMSRFRSRFAGLPDLPLRGQTPIATALRKRAGLDEVGRALTGQDTGNPVARAMANSLRDASEYLRQEMNRAGIPIPKLENYIPQSHNMFRVGEVSEDEWLDFIRPLLNRDRVIAFDTGLRMDDEQLDALLRDAYRRIKTDGLSDMDPSDLPISSTLMARRLQHRILHFRDYDAWKAYNERFGAGDLFQAWTTYISGMARDIGIVQALGPNPDATVRFIVQSMRRTKGQAAIELTGNQARRALRGLSDDDQAIINTYDHLRGATNYGAETFWASITAALRNDVAAAFLGGSWFSAYADLNLTNLGARFNRIPVSSILSDYMRTFTPWREADRRMAARLGFISDSWTSQAVSVRRVLGDLTGPEWSRWVADVVLRASFLDPFTSAGRMANYMSYLAEVTELGDKGTRFDQLSPQFREMLGRHRIEESHWTAISNTERFRDPERGATFVRPQDVAQENREAGERLHQMLLTEVEFAVPLYNPRASSILTGGTRPNTFVGILTRNVTQFKSFPVLLTYLHFQRALSRRMAVGGVVAGAGLYTAWMFIGATLFGMLGEQASQLTQGKDLLPLIPGRGADREQVVKNWTKGMLRGGGVGIFGDFLFQEHNRYGGGIAETLAGPIGGTILPAAGNTFIDNLQRLAKGEDTRFLRDLLRFIYLLQPGRSLWYTRLAEERLIIDELEMMIDPNAARRFELARRRTRRESGQDFFAPRGRGFPPERLPDFGNIAP